jgi:ferrous-iron efflux pump FieF
VTDARRKFVAATIAATVAALLAVAKLAVSLLTGSLAVLASAVDSLMDVACSGLNAFFLRLAANPPDREHAYGHGKAEALSGVVQALIIAMGGVWLVARSVMRLFALEAVATPDAGVAVSAIALVISLGLVVYLRREARVTRSIALEADAFHYVTDIATNTVAGIALLGYRIFGWKQLDPLASLAIALYIIWASIGILRHASDELLDRGLSRDTEDDVKAIISSLAPEVRGYDTFRSRRAGGTQFFEFVLLVDRATSFERSHELAERAASLVRERHGDDTQVMVHTDPV